MKQFLTLILAILCSTSIALATTHTGTTGDCTWTLDTDEGTLVISGTGAMEDYEEKIYSYSSHSSAPWYSYKSYVKTVTIEDGVTSIGDWAFYNFTSLKSVTIGSGVTSIGSMAFSDCSSLTSITIPDGVTSIGSSAFEYCSSLTSITIPDGVTSIGDYAFYNCTSLTSITIPDGVTSIGEQAFRSCSSLTSITIPDGVTSIGYSAFRYCTSLTSITIGSGVTSIGNYAFYNCTSLTSITIPDGVTSIDNYAFSGCSKLTTVYSLNETPPTVYQYTFSSIYEQATLYAPELYQSRDYWKEFYTIYVNSGSCGDDLTWLYCDGTLTISGTGAMSNFYEDESPWYEDYAGSITTVVIGSEVTSIGTYAFYNLINLTSVYSYNETAPTARSTSFDSDTYKYATLYVTSNDYATADYWENFTKSETIEEEEEENNAISSVTASTSAIRAIGNTIVITTEAAQTAQVYSLAGQLIVKQAVAAGETSIGMPTGGVYVVVLNDGTRAKVLVK